MKRIHFFANRPEDIYLVAQTRSYFQNRKIDLSLSYTILDIKLNDRKNNMKQWWKDLPFLFKMIDRYKNNKSLFAHNDEYFNIELLDRLSKIVNSIPECELYCFSLYDMYFIPHLFMGFLLKRKYPNCDILYGGPEVILNRFSRFIIKDNEFYPATGDIEATLYNYVIEKNFDNSFINMNELELEDIPIYYDFELKMLNKRIVLNNSRGCRNGCRFCSAPKLSPFRKMDDAILVDWVIEFNKQGVDYILMNANTFNDDPDLFRCFLQDLIYYRNKIHIEAGITFTGLTNEHLDLFSQSLFVHPRFGLESVSPEMQKTIKKNMPSYRDIYMILNSLSKQDCCGAPLDIVLFYILGFPGHTEKIFKEEVQFIKTLLSSFPYLGIQVFRFFVSPESYIEKNLEKFNLKPIFDINWDDIPEIRKYPQYLKLMSTFPKGYLGNLWSDYEGSRMLNYLKEQTGLICSCG